MTPAMSMPSGPRPNGPIDLAPAMSVVVALASGRVDHLRRHLAALSTGTRDQSIEIVVPYDAASSAVTALAADYPAVKFVLAAGVDTRGRRDRPGFIDKLRTTGLRAARGAVVALTEDWTVPGDGWMTSMQQALDRAPNAGAAGGAIECESTSTLGWAVWFCDFYRYQPPIPPGPTAWASDTNVAYRRSALDRIAGDWADGYHEPSVHAALARVGLGMQTAPDAVMIQARGDLSLLAALEERFVWARSFAGARARALGGRRWLLAALCPTLPVVLTWRVVTTTLGRGRHGRRLMACLPIVILLESVWTLGECVGYVTAELE